MNKPNTQNGSIIIYQTKDGKTALEVKLKEETIWLDAHQIALLFGVDRTGVVKHMANIYKSGELQRKSTCAKIAQVAKDGKIREMDFYNLDMIISVGYRVNSKRATQFRIWATKVLKDHLLKGFTVNQKRLQEKGLKEFEEAVGLIKKTIASKQLSDPEVKGLLQIITDYANSWILLQKYDENRLGIGKITKPKIVFQVEEGLKAIEELKKKLIAKKEASDIFGQARDQGLQRIFGSLYQTFDKKELYPGLEEKAAHLLYFIIKDHPFVDGNKRIGSFLFIVFLARNKFLFQKNGEKKINDVALVALALLIAESHPKEKETMIKLVMNLIK